ncbi:ATP-binding protein [Pseudomonas indica]|uniref:ATP-binding protein n=1 Tax=Pseudomonas indica TaxID=137658 RepID=UPI000BABF4C8|nr:AAA family ATPase [Pseudomonas indica]PAU51820.1 AAA family ATPase [Pseudomonas indica]
MTRPDTTATTAAQRLPAELAHATELERLAAADRGPRPEGWRLSPAMVRTFILGGEVSGEPVARKIFGNDDVVERAIVTLVGQRGLMLVGEPGTAKSLLSELLAAAICGDSTLTVQGSAGVVEEHIRYGWNYALLLRSGPGPDALVPGPLHRAMSRGALLRFEEITRCPTEVQDNLIPILSERLLHVPEMKESEGACLLARPGFNVIATANLKDRGVNDMSSALKRRFNFETMRPLARLQDQKELLLREVNRQLDEQGVATRLPADVAQLLAAAFHELRAGSVEGTAIEPPSTVLSTAEAISVAFSAAVQCHYFGEPELRPRHLSRFMLGTVIKDDEQDARRLRDYLRVVRRVRAGSAEWMDFADSQGD